MPLWEIFRGAWKDYRKSFKLILKTYWWLDIFPKILLFSIVGLVFLLLILNSAPNFGASNDVGLTETLNSLNPFSLTENAVAGSGDLSLRYSSGFLTALVIFMGVVLLFSSIWLYLILYYACFYNEKGDLTFKRAAKGGISYFWKFLGLVILVLLIILLLHVPASLALVAIINYWNILDAAIKFILVLLCIALFIITFVFSIYILINWLFSPYILVKEDEGSVGSLRKSKDIVMGRWWKVLGCLLLIGIFSTVVYWLFSVSAFLAASLISMLASLTTTLNLITVSIILQAVGAALAYLLGLAGTIITVPFVIFFFKNLYLESRKGTKKVRKELQRPKRQNEKARKKIRKVRKKGRIAGKKTRRKKR